MRKFLKKIWFPAIVVLFATIQTFGMEIIRMVENPTFTDAETQSEDTVIYNNSKIFTKFRKKGEKIEADTVKEDNILEAEKYISARDTIKVPDSLKLTDPFRYKYYIALVDSLTHRQIRDSLLSAGDTLTKIKLDSIYYADSTIAAKKKFELWYNSLDKDARKKYDFDKKMKRRQKEIDSILNVKDSLNAIRDSIREGMPRILQTFAIPKEMQYKRIISWRKDPMFNDVHLHDIDTSYNYWFNDYPFMRKDINATYLGIIGSPVQNYDAFKRQSEEKVSFYAPYEVYSYAPHTIPMYNTKTPYTELAYYGTLFAHKENEEADIHIMTTQNILPELNARLEYNRYGANGLLKNETTDNRTFAATLNYMGKRYLAHVGYISNKITRKENGGIINSFWIRDTTVGAREIETYLSKADNLIKKKTFFVDQTYRIPFTFIKNLANKIKGTNSVKNTPVADSLAKNPTDTKAQGAKNTKPKHVNDTIDTEVTTAFIGHSSEFSSYSKLYQDNIALTDKQGRKFYNNFFINPVTSRDSLRVMRIENKIFLKLQPWADDAIVSSLNVGIGDRILNYYMFRPESYLIGTDNTIWHSMYLYGGAGGQFRKFIKGDALGYYTFLGSQINDVGLEANASFNIYPFRRQKNSPISFKIHFKTTAEEPEFYEQHYFSNHYRWDNKFKKISDTKIEGSLEIPHWNLKAGAGYSLLGNNLYYGTDGIIRQNSSPMSIAKIYLMKNFRLWKLHFDNTALFQISSNEKVLPLPMVALNLRWYLQFNVVKNVMQMQIGGNITYNTAWYAPAYNPALGQFITQNSEKFGNSPYADAFINIQWKRACIFVKLVNANMGWPLNSADYFSAAGYIRPEKAIRFGVYWPFYLQPNKNSSVSGKAGGSMGGRESSPGGSGGRLLGGGLGL